jgi:type III restriction enzyme
VNGASPVDNNRWPLAGFQQEAMAGLQATILRVAEHHIGNPGHQREIALKTGVMLLESPTGSGKTLILGRTLEGLRGDLPRKCVWFWFAPYTGLVTQTQEALSQQCGALRLRAVYSDREPAGTRDGDVFLQTWAAVAAHNKNARTVRRRKEDLLSLDDFIASLRDELFFIGVVIDEAHLNFGASATAAAQFYLDTLQPDFTVLATATPNDDKLQQFEQKAGIEVASRVVIDREQVVNAGLNKRGLMLGILRFRDEDAAVIDIEQATLTAAWFQHEAVKRQLAGRKIALTPLMLVQVEDQQKGGEDPVVRVREKLIQAGVPSERIKSHTSGEPDPDFHTLAYDPEVEVLIFKVAVATGFDAPRAWTLVSVRPNRGREFGLQIVGRIMRVHPLVRPFHGNDTLLDRGYVFLTDTELQAGLTAAVEDLKAVRHGMELITDRLDVVQFGNIRGPLDSEYRCSQPEEEIAEPPPGICDEKMQ